MDRYETVRNYDVIVANFNGEFVCKILDAQCRLLAPFNELYQPVTIHEYGEFSIEVAC